MMWIWWEGDAHFYKPDEHNTFSAFGTLSFYFQFGAISNVLSSIGDILIISSKGPKSSNH